jgi:hypothetical protein
LQMALLIPSCNQRRYSNSLKHHIARVRES